MQVSGQVLLPGMAMFEAALASTDLALATQPVGSLAALEGISIVAPMAIGPRTDNILEVSLAAASGGLTVYSLTGAAARRQLHLRAAATFAVTGSVAASEPSVTPASTEQDSSATERVVAAASQMEIPCVAALLGSVVQELQRFNGGAVAALEAAQATSGSAYAMHPAVADACLHTGAVFVPVPQSAVTGPADAAPRASATIPVAVAALATPSSGREGISICGGVYGSMGAARIVRGGTSFCDFRMRSAAEEPRTAMALVQLQGKPVSAVAQAEQPIATAAQAVNAMLYAVEWRVSTVGAAEGSPSLVLPTALHRAEWAAVPRTGLLRRFRLPRSGTLTAPCSQTRGCPAAWAGAQCVDAAAGNLAVVQELLRMPFAAGQRLQQNTAGPLPDGMPPLDGLPATAMAAASAAAILKV